LLPLLANHDHERFEIFCYSNSGISDALTEKLRSQAEVWRSILGVKDAKAAELIQADKIDILVDLSLHMADNRMLLFARKPGRVQLTYLGYCGTTGLEAMDFRLSDPHLDPPDGDLTVYSEQTIRLPTSYWCYQPGGESPEVSPLPSASGAPVTFGCLNNFAKVSSAAMDLWAKVLAAVPGSRLILNCPAGSHRAVVEEKFVSRGVGADRLEFFAMRPWVDYMRAYHRIDIALDPIPYGGGITTCDALWMGVPVVSLNGGTAVGRGGRTILSNVGLAELLGYSSDDYVRIAAELAGDRQRLTDLRAGLRGRMEQSALMDAKRFTREVEAAYLQMWGKINLQEQ
jgi:predicted O-linked N-acetylglucosamine transferase (SPINDLY family)